ARDGQVAWLFGTAGHDDGVEFSLQRFGGAYTQAIRRVGFVTDIGGCLKLYAFGFELAQAAVDVHLFHFEIGNAVAQQAADTAAFFKDGDAVSGACQLLGAGQSGRARADDSHFFASAELRRLGAYPAFLPAAFDNGVLNRFDTDRIIVDV